MVHFCLFKNGIAHEFDVYTIYGHMLGQNLSSKHPLVGQFKRLKCEQCHLFLLLQKWHWFAAFADPLWLIATIEYIALCHYLWFNDDMQLSCVAYSHHRVCSIGNKGKPGKIKDKLSVTICG